MNPPKLPPVASRILPLAAATLLPLWPLSAAHAAYDLPALEQVEKEVETTAQKAMPTVVALTHAEKMGMASGSGCVISKGGLIATAAHVVGHATILKVIFPDGKMVHARVLGADYRKDVALAQITEPGAYPFMELGDSTKLKPGDMVIALGNAGGFDPRRKPPVRFGRVFEVMPNGELRTDCVLISGDSGGPLFDLEGRLVGIHTTIGEDMSQNNDMPVQSLREDWDRLMKGDHWDQLESPLVSTLSPGELHGLDVQDFQQLIMRQALLGNGTLQQTPAKMRAWLTQCGMDKTAVKAMSNTALNDFVQKALGNAAKVLMGHGFDNSLLPKVNDKDLYGLDILKFRDQIAAEGIKSGGALKASPGEIKQWLLKYGMAPDHVATMSAADLANFMARAFGGAAKVTSHTTVIPQGYPASAGKPVNADGLDMDNLRQCIIAAAMQSDGKVIATPEIISKWLVDCGMKPERVKAMSPLDMASLVGKAMAAGGGAVAAGNTLAPAASGTSNASRATASAALTDADLAGLDINKLKQRIMEEALKNNGKVAASPADYKQWMREAGMREDAVKGLTLLKISEILKKVLLSNDSGAGTLAFGGEEPDAVVQEDADILTALKPTLDKVVPGMVSLESAGKPLALGTIVKSDGFILTKHSEIANVNALQARLADGRTFPAVEVKQFPEQDLALVKIDAAGLPAVTIPDRANDLRLGSFVFSPGASEDDPVTGEGVVSVLQRSLQEKGGFLGVMLMDATNAVEIGNVVPFGPGSRAGLHGRDQILAIDGKPSRSAENLRDQIRNLKPGTVIHLKYRRGNTEGVATVTLGDREKFTAAAQNADNPVIGLGADLSRKHTGFPMVFQHDQPLKPEECGGVVIDLHGNVVGVNIARAGRVNSYAIPSDVVAGLLKSVDFQALGQKAAKSTPAPSKA